MSEIPLIAVVDDDEAIREAIQSLLRSVGLRAAVFASAEDFLHSGQLQAADCLIVDVRMPRMSALVLVCGAKFRMVNRYATLWALLELLVRREPNVTRPL